MTRSILIPYDFGDAADAALDWVAMLSKREPVTIHLLHLVKLPTSRPTRAANDATPELDVIRSQLEDTARRRGLQATVTVETTTSVSEAIVNTAHENRSDLIVMGTHGRGTIERAFVGSVALDVVRHAPCPVVTIRGPLGSRRSVMDPEGTAVGSH